MSAGLRSSRHHRAALVDMAARDLRCMARRLDRPITERMARECIAQARQRVEGPAEISAREVMRQATAALRETGEPHLCPLGWN